MNPRPLRLLTAGYGLAAATGGLLLASGAPFLAALLAFWLGGAILTLALGLLPGVSRPFRLPAELELEAELRRWEEDRLADRLAAEAAGATRGNGGRAAG